MRFYLHFVFLMTGIFFSLSCRQLSPAPPAQATTQPLPEVRALLEKGQEAEKQSRPDEALRLYEQALHLAQARKDRAGEGAALAAQGQQLLYDKPAESQALFEQALSLYRENNDKAGQAKSLFFLGNTAALLKNPKQALRRYDAAYRLYKESDKKPGQALTLLMTGNVYRDAGQSSQTIPYYEQALALFRELDDKPRQVMTLISLSRSYLEKHDTAHGSAYLEQARPLAQEIKDKNLESMIVHNLGGVYSYQGKNPQAIAMFEQALPLLEAGGDKKQIASCLDNLGLLTFRTGDFLKSLACLNRAVRMQQEAGDRQGLAVSLDILAQNYSYLGQRERALALSLQAVRASEESGNLRTRAQNMNNLGSIYGEMDKLPEAKIWVERALNLFRQIDDKNGQAFALYFLSGNRQKAGAAAQAMALNARARQLFRQTKDRDGEAATLLRSGDLALEGGRFAEAHGRYLQALAGYQAVNNTYEEAIALARLGMLEESRGDRKRAEPFYVLALMRQEAMRASLGGLATTKSHYHEKEFPLYQRYIHLLLETKQNVRAFAWTQKAKARALIDLMKVENSNTAQTLNPEDRLQAERLVRQDKALSQQWFAALSGFDGRERQARPDARRQQKAEIQTRAIRQRQQRLEADWGVFQEQLSLHNPRLAQQGPARTVTLDEIGAFLPEDTALLEYMVVRTGLGKAEREELALFVVTQQGGKARLKVCRLQTAFRELVRKAQDLREACAGQRPYQELARSLYRLLIAPAEAALRGKRRLIFCPDGPLWDIPFQALLVAAPSAGKPPRAEFLWERYALSYAYSVTEIKAALDIRQRPNRPQSQQAMLLMASPDFGQSAPGAENRKGGTTTRDETVHSLYLRTGGLRALPYTRVEANAILEAFPNAALKTGGEAQEAVIKQTGGDYRYLHFATHAVFNDAAPMLSGIVLARPPLTSPEDGILTVRELLDLNLGAEMLVLSACDTARGANQQGEGLIGLTWAAFVAGIPTQVVSQWAVDDAMTARLMGAFYQRLKQGEAKDSSLRKAALTLLHDGAHQHPFYWAPFLLMGDWR